MKRRFHDVSLKTVFWRYIVKSAKLFINLKFALKTKKPRILGFCLIYSGSRIRTYDLRVMSPTSYHCSIPQRDNPQLNSGSRIRTYDLRVMSPTSYHCSIPHQLQEDYCIQTWLFCQGYYVNLRIVLKSWYRSCSLGMGDTMILGINKHTWRVGYAHD